GPMHSGKTSLIVGIGTEHAFRLGTARYLAYFEFLQLADAVDEPNEPYTQKGRDLWPWRRSNILIIDDIDPGLRRQTIVRPRTCVSSCSPCRRRVWQSCAIARPSGYWAQWSAPRSGSRR